MIDQLVDPAFYQNLFGQVKDWTMTHIFVVDNFLQFAFQVLLLILSRAVGEVLGRWLRKALEKRLEGFSIIRYPSVSNLLDRIVQFIPLLLSMFILWICMKWITRADSKTYLMVLVLNLSMAWVVIQVATSIIPDRLWRRLVAALAWLFAALNIIGLLDETITLLERIGFTIGEVRLNLLSVLKAAILLVILFKVVRWVSDTVEKKLSNVSELTPSSRLMIGKSIHITLLFIAVLVAMNSIGIDLTALAVFSGAIGVGIGFGLQKVVANFISGLILLSDKSVKPGDVIEIGSVYGWVKQMGGRCVSVITRDEKEYLIPNEDLITSQVINWSYSSNQIRIKADVGISYHADPHQAIQLIQDCVKGIDRILETPSPRCLLMGFGDNSVDLQLRFWINDPQNGVANVRSEAMLRVWDTLKANHIEIPFPQRDVHLFLPEDTKEALSPG